MISPENIKFFIIKQETSMIINLFNLSTNCSVPQVVGCLDSTHCAIVFPDSDSKEDHCNRKKAYSVNTQAVVGERLKSF